MKLPYYTITRVVPYAGSTLHTWGSYVNLGDTIVGHDSDVTFFLSHLEDRPVAVHIALWWTGKPTVDPVAYSSSRDSSLLIPPFHGQRVVKSTVLFVKIHRLGTDAPRPVFSTLRHLRL